MNIFGIGTDIVNVKRMQKSLRRNGDAFKKRIFSKMKLSIVKEKKIPPHFTQRDLLLRKL